MSELVVRDIPSTDPSTWRLKSHQQDNLDFFRTKARALSLLGYGAGKTAVAILRMGDLIEQYRILVVTTNGTILKWAHDIKTWGRREWKVITLTGKREERMRKIREPHNIAIINFEGLRVMLEGAGESFAKSYGVVIVDEIHRCKNPLSDISRDLAIVCHPKYADFVYGLTGSPVLESMLDIFSIMLCVNPSLFGSDYEAWRDRYFEHKSVDGEYPKWVLRPGAYDFLKEKLHSISFIRSEEECDLQLPQKYFDDPLVVNLRGITRKVYATAQGQLHLALKHQVISLVDIYPRLEKLCQLSRGWCYDKNHVAQYFPEHDALDRLCEYVEDIRGTGRCVIWAHCPPDMAMVGHMLDRMGFKDRYKIIFGGIRNLNKRRSVATSFNNGLFPFLIANPKCMGEGLDLQAKYSTRYSYRWSALEWSQPNGRFLRISSQAEYVRFRDVVVDDTVDVGILRAARGKLDFGAGVKERPKELDVRETLGLSLMKTKGIPWVELKKRGVEDVIYE